MDIFIQLINMSVNASYVVLAVIILRMIFRNVPKWIHCAMWLLVGFRLICPFSFESDWSIMPSESAISQSTVIVDEYERPQYDASEFVQENTIPSDSAYVEQERTQQLSPIDEQITSERSIMQNIMHYIPYVWIIGLAIISIYGGISYVILRRRVSEAVRLRGNIYQCDRIDSPFMMGVIRPKIYLPFGLSEQNMEYVIAHEQTHIRRLDNITKIFAFALTAVYWFNPIIWLAYVLLCRDIELACDESVIRDKNTAERKAYSMALLECSTDNSMRFIYNASPISFGEIGVKQRVVNVIKNKKTAVWVICAAVAACAVVAALLLTNSKSYSVDVSDELDNAVAQAIFDYNKVSASDVEGNWYECFGEGHAILGVEENDKDVTVYVVCSYYGYTFMNDNLVSSTGYSLVPTEINFGIDESGNYIYKSHKEPMDGAFWVDSLKEMFPKSLAQKVLNIKGDERNVMTKNLAAQCDEYAKAYLKKIGREAKVGGYGAFDFKIFSDYGVSTKVSDAFLELFPNYDIYVGNFERVENGVRYIYEVSWYGDREGNGIAKFGKYEYGTYKKIEETGYKVSGDTYTKIEGNVPDYYETVDANGDKVYFDNKCKLYKYKLTLTGTHPNAVKSSTITVLTNNKNLTFEEVSSYMFSSQHTDEAPYYWVIELN